MKCPKCEYEWKNIIPQPKLCPRCKTRLSYKDKNDKKPRVWRFKEWLKRR